MVSYICTMYRSKLLCCLKEPSLITIQDGATMTEPGWKGPAIRLLLLALLGAILAIPALTIKIEYVGSAIIILFTNVIVPVAIGAYVLTGGIYDAII